MIAAAVDLPGARAVFSDRRDGVSEGPYESLNLGILTDDDQERVSENRRRLAGATALEPERIAMGWQVHGSDLKEWRGGAEAFAAPGAELDRVDGHVTEVAGVGLLVLVADCYPVALAGAGRAAMLHCGWRGVADGIVGRAAERFAEPPSAAVGPGIGGCCYEVGDEVLSVFADVPGAASGRMLDLRVVIQARLRESGIERIEHVAECTSCNPERYFSHRRDHGVTGRQAGLVWLA